MARKYAQVTIRMIVDEISQTQLEHLIRTAILVDMQDDLNPGEVDVRAEVFGHNVQVLDHSGFALPLPKL